MATPAVPMRPRRGSYDLKPEEMDCLNWIVLSGCPRDEAFVRFIRPDYLANINSPAVKNAVKQFFAMAEVKEYMDAYRETITDASKPRERPAGSMEERKARAKAKAVEFAMSLADNIDDADDPETVLKLMDKVGLLDQDEEVVEQPRRYLPVTCGDCKYRKFVEENCEEVDDGTDFDNEETNNNNE